jgi:biotin carboxyl carrier protein
MTSAEQRAFEHTRARIERNLGKISALAGEARLAPAEFFRQFVELTVDSLEAAGGAVWAREGENWSQWAAVRMASSGIGLPAQKEWIGQALAQCLATRKTCIVAAGPSEPESDSAENPGPGNAIACPFFYVPLLLEGQVRAVLQVWLAQPGDPRCYGDIATFLGQLTGQATAYLRAIERKNLSEALRDKEHRLGFQEELLGELNPRLLAAHTANFLVDLVPCDLACVLQRRGRKWHLVAVSNQEALDPRSVQSRALAGLGSTLAETETGVMVALAENSEGEPAAPERWLAEAGLRAAQWCHLRSSRKSGLDFLVLAAWHTQVPSGAASREVLAWAARQLGKALDAATHFHHLPLRPLTALAGRINRAWHMNRRRKVILLVILPAILLAGGLALPLPWKVSADCTVVPRRVVAVVAESSGKIAEVAVREGERVQAGQLLGRLDDTDYVLQLAVARQQRQRWEVEAARAHALDNDAERKIAEIQLRREEENIRHLEYLQSRTRLLAPIDGTVLTRNLHDKEGEALPAGEVFCEIGSADEYDIQLDLRQKDLGTLLAALGEGRALSAEFILHAHPTKRLRVELTDPAQISQLPQARRDQTVFLARLPFPGDDAAGLDLKSGYTGRAKILLGRRPAGVLLLQPFLHYWRTNWGV